MKILGIACSFWHDPSAALLIDGEVVAAAQQERFSRNKHAVDELPIEAARYCLETAGIGPDDLELIAYPWSIEGIRANRWPYVRRNWRRLPGKALRMIYAARRRERRILGKLHRTLQALGIDRDTIEIECVEHHLAHASSAYHFSGFEDAAIVCIDGMGEVTSTLFARGRGASIEKIHEIPKPDSLGLFYLSMTDYLGFEINDGEYKVMGMASYGDPSRADLSGLLRCKAGDLKLDLDYLQPPPDMRLEGRTFSHRLVERLGPAREGDTADEPYIHIAAATQKIFEEASIDLIESHLAAVLERSGKLCFAGGCALNVGLSRKLIDHPLVDELFVPPGAGDSGTSLGAASYAATRRGETIQPLEHPFFGPGFSNDEVAAELRGLRIPFQKLEDPAATAAQLLASGQIVAWFQGRLEWGERALGNRSILGHPALPGTADEINARIKYRERWRPFCPSILEERAAEILGTKHPSPFMSYSFKVTPEWSGRIPEVVHVDGTLRPQIVSREANPRYYRLISEFERRTGLPVVINTSLNRRGEPMICRPSEALAMFYASGLEHLIIEDLYVSKRPAGVDLPEG